MEAGPDCLRQAPLELGEAGGLVIAGRAGRVRGRHQLERREGRGVGNGVGCEGCGVRSEG